MFAFWAALNERRLSGKATGELNVRYVREAGLKLTLPMPSRSHFHLGDVAH